jgi:hypothetical protein
LLTEPLHRFNALARGIFRPIGRLPRVYCTYRWFEFAHESAPVALWAFAPRQNAAMHHPEEVSRLRSQSCLSVLQKDQIRTRQFGSGF